MAQDSVAQEMAAPAAGGAEAPVVSDSAQVDMDLSAIVPTRVVRIAGGFCIAAGVFTILLGAQTYGIVSRWSAFLVLAVLVKLGLGVATAYLGTKVMRYRGWASVAATASAGCSALVAGIWFIYALVQGVLSLLAFALVPLTLTSVLLAALTIPAARRADAARGRLSEAGLEAGD
jgi:hypothetical protein